MTGRLFAVGVGVASIVALGGGAIISACYSPPQPVCGFVCGPAGLCPDDYTCQADSRCHLNGAPMMACDMIDAGPSPEFVSLIDATEDAQPDALIDAELIDAEIPDAMDDAGADAMTDAGVDAMDDAAIDAQIDAMADAAIMIDAQMVDSAPSVDAIDAPPDPDAGAPADAGSD
jgi:hypothetical protein